MAGRVIVVGSVNIDLVVTTERLPTPGETVTGGLFERHHGGKGGNQAVAAARMGVPTAFIGAVGDDKFGREAREALVAEDIDVGGLQTIEGDATGVALILVDAAGENSIAVAGGANAALTVAHVTEALRRHAPRSGDVVLVGHEIPTEATAAALSLAREAGATTILNPAPAAGLDAATVATADLVVPNEGELGELRAAGIEPRTLLVSLGAAGAGLMTPNGDIVIRAPQVDALDTTGAGDTLNGVLAAGLAAGLPIEKAARRAVMAASLAVTRPGAREGMPTAVELDAAVG